MIQQSSFQSLTILFVFAIELWSEKISEKDENKVSKRDESAEKIEKQEVNERNKRRDERWRMKNMKHWFFI